MTATDITNLVRRLAALGTEIEWVEFKVNNKDPEKIGETISSLANAAAYLRQPRAFMVWGVHNETHEIVGTDFQPRKMRCHGQDLEHYLSTQLHPHTDFFFREATINDHFVVVLEINPARYAPIAYKGEEWIRIGSSNKPLRRFTEKERALWASFDDASFEAGIAATNLDEKQVESLLMYQDYWLLAQQEPPPLREALARLVKAKVLLKEENSRFNITNLGALLFAKNTDRFDTIKRKSLRLAFYPGPSRAAEKFMETKARRGYASGFTGLIGYLMSRLPKSEEIKKALRVEVPMYPEIALREVIANALIHQDFEIDGAGPMVEVFSDRIEITNPGTPLNDIHRLLDLPPKSRNVELAQLMQAVRICEERGTGIDKLLTVVEAFQLPAPDFQTPGDHTRVVLYAPKPFAKMSRTDRIRACYQHAGLMHVSNQVMTNETLRRRFGFSDKNKAMATRIIQDTVASQLIRPYDPASSSRRHAKYVPFWAE